MRVCCVCGREFSPHPCAANRPNVTCGAACRKEATRLRDIVRAPRKKARRRERYHTDPEFRRKHLDDCIARHKTPEARERRRLWMKEYNRRLWESEEYRARRRVEGRENKRKRYHADPEFRRCALENCKKWRRDQNATAAQLQLAALGVKLITPRCPPTS